MTQPFYARWAGRFLGEHAEEPEPVAEHDRDAAIVAIERAIRERGRQKARARWAMRASIAAAAIVVVGVGVAALRSGSQRVAEAPAATSAPVATGASGATGATGATGARPDAPVTITGSATGLGATISSGPGAVFALTSDARVAPGHRIVARGRSRATLAFSTGSQISVENGGDLTVVEEGQAQVFSLSAGEIRARVAKLGAGERFVVKTPDAEVEVRGTSFGVAIAAADASCGGGTVTRVTVDEGVVVVRRGATETRVARGEEWPAACEAPATTPNHANASANANANANANASASASANANANASTLVEQNNAFAEAVAYKNNGQHAAAVAAFERFVAKYPSSNLAENAAAERMKLLLADDHPRGVAAARQYLRRYPNGFAQADAKAAISGSP